MNILLVYESMFGNTRLIAESIASGLADLVDVSIVEVAQAPAELPSDVHALVVGGPTHVFSMSRQRTRAQAVAQGAHTEVGAQGIREWLEALPRPQASTMFVAFDTRVDMPLMPGAASHSASRFARKHGFLVLQPRSFLVEGYEGPLVEGEIERARNWGEGLARVFSGE